MSGRAPGLRLECDDPTPHHSGVEPFMTSFGSLWRLVGIGLLLAWATTPAALADGLTVEVFKGGFATVNSYIFSNGLIDRRDGRAAQVLRGPEAG